MCEYYVATYLIAVMDFVILYSIDKHNNLKKMLIPSFFLALNVTKKGILALIIKFLHDYTNAFY